MPNRISPYDAQTWRQRTPKKKNRKKIVHSKSNFGSWSEAIPWYINHEIFPASTLSFFKLIKMKMISTDEFDRNASVHNASYIRIPKRIGRGTPYRRIEMAHSHDGKRWRWAREALRWLPQLLPIVISSHNISVNYSAWMRNERVGIRTFSITISGIFLINMHSRSMSPARHLPIAHCFQ